MVWVLRVMLLGAATALAAGFVGFSQEGAIADSYRSQLAEGRDIGITADQVDSTAHNAAVAGMVQAAVVAAVWVGLALMLQRRHVPARWLTSALCVANVGLEVLFVLASIKLGSTGTSPAVSVGLQSVNAACALATLVLLWRPAVRAWFAPHLPDRDDDEPRAERRRRTHPVREPSRSAISRGRNRT